MKTYPLLNTPVPVISYCIFHQPKKGRSGDEYVNTMRALHERVQKESGEMKNAFAKGVREAIARESQMVSGLLSQFLTTPIQSDRAEVRRVIAEGIERSLGQAGMNSEIGVSWSSEGKTCFPPHRKALERKLQQNGKAYLQDLGFTSDGSAGDIFESVFVVEGGINLDLIEHSVRDRVGIYSPPHGTHLGESTTYTFGAYNLVYASGTRPPQEQKKGLVEISFSFSKPPVEYALFRKALAAGLEQYVSGDAALYTSLWQRKLGLGRGKEFILRFLCDEMKKLDGIMKWLHERRDPDFPAEALAEKGAMLLKELLA
ncbi:hypothetical protein EHM92_01670 [bacterium]|nr:MAG: hypothetical protein EHM92_01670 [bacterium]